MTENTSNGADYQISFINNSLNSGTFMLFQQDPSLTMPGLKSIAWITKFANPGTQGFFSWNLSYNFSWTESESPASGITSGSSQSFPAGHDLATMNGITLTYNEGFSFIDPVDQSPAGSLYIKQDASIPMFRATVGIGMAGAPTFMVQAEPNMDVTFTPHPEYWITFGEFTQGEAIDVQEVAAKALQVSFPPGITKMRVTLNPDNTWTVGPA
jgi:rhizosphere induced protein